ncbi:class I SAM-dependent methyltransferase [Undibacterium sp. TJN19]|uniref:class I SAM-dependent methyltransferase n=1 Tax=Undibacterium sp. TJN19 TaxID=3413055 RepID=UPI003BF33211
MTNPVSGTCVLSPGDASASRWLKRFTHLLPNGQVLDLACGQGRNTYLLLERGFEVLALDRDVRNLPDLAIAGASTMQHDLESGSDGYRWPFPEDTFAAIVVCNYLHRPLFPYLLASLKAGGVLIYETFAQGNEVFGKPSNPAFLLQRGELLTQMQSNSELTMTVIAYEEGYVDEPKPAIIQRICARKSEKTSVLDKL